MNAKFSRGISSYREKRKSTWGLLHVLPSEVYLYLMMKKRLMNNNRFCRFDDTNVVSVFMNH